MCTNLGGLSICISKTFSINKNRSATTIECAINPQFLQKSMEVQTMIIECKPNTYNASEYSEVVNYRVWINTAVNRV